MLNELRRASSDRRAAMPRYVRIYSTLRQWINSGKFAPGEKLASEEEICQMFGVSRITTRKAIELLVEDDLVTRSHGKGTYVSESLPQRAGLENFSKRMRNARRIAMQSRIDRVEISEIEADARACLDLKIAQGKRVTRVAYVRNYKDTPIAYAVSLIPADFGLVVKPEDLVSDTPLSLLDKAGFHAAGAHQLIRAAIADVYVTDLLAMNMGSPVLRIQQIVVDRSQTPLESFVVHYRGDIYEHPVVLHHREDLDLVHGIR